MLPHYVWTDMQDVVCDLQQSGYPFQLDWLAGTFPDHAAYLEGVAHLPKRVEASVLVVR